MADPITWRNIGAPQFGSLASDFAVTTHGIDSAVNTLKGLLDQRRTNEAAAWQSGKERNTAALLDHLASFTDPEAAKTAIASGDIDALKQSFGSQFDMNAVRTAQSKLVPELQQRAIADQTFKDQQEEVKQRDVVSGLVGALQRAATPEEASNIKQAIDIYRDSGYLNAKGATELFDKALARAGVLKTDAWNDEQHGFVRADAKRKEAMHPYEIAAKVASTNSSNASANASRADAEYKRALAAELPEKTSIERSKVRNAELDAQDRLLATQTKAIEEVRKNTPFAKRVSTADTEELVKSLDKAAKWSDGTGTTVLNYLSKNPIKTVDETGKETAIDIPVQMLITAAGKYGSSWGRYTDAQKARFIREDLQEQLKVPENIAKYAEANLALAKAGGRVSNTTPEQDAKFIENAAAHAQGKPIQLDSGALKFSSDKAIKVSNGSGVVTAGNLARGASEVKIEDGDTITLKGGKDGDVRFRFAGIDAQETGKEFKGSNGQKWSEAAKQFVTDQLKSGEKVEVRVVSNKADGKSRQLAEVFVGGKNINDLLIRNGLALPYMDKDNPIQAASRRRLMDLAIREKRGMHQDMGTNEGMSPSLYRGLGEQNVY